MKAKELDQIVKKIALSKHSVKTPYLVLDALQTFYTQNLNKTPSDLPANSLVGSSLALISAAPPQFPSKVIPLCGNGQHNPLVKNHPESCCFQKFPHLWNKPKVPKNASASFFQETALMAFASSVSNDFFFFDSAAKNHMIRDRSLFTKLTSSNIEVTTSYPNAPLVAEGHGLAIICVNGKDIILSNCLLVTSISQQLISLVQILQGSLRINQSGNNFSLKDNSGILMTSTVSNNLLSVKITPSP